MPAISDIIVVVWLDQLAERLLDRTVTFDAALQISDAFREAAREARMSGLPPVLVDRLFYWANAAADRRPNGAPDGI